MYRPHPSGHHAANSARGCTTHLVPQLWEGRGGNQMKESQLPFYIPPPVYESFNLQQDHMRSLMVPGVEYSLMREYRHIQRRSMRRVTDSGRSRR